MPIDLAVFVCTRGKLKQMISALTSIPQSLQQWPDLKYEPKVGQSAKHAFEQTLVMAQKRGVPIAVTYNNVPLAVTPESSLTQLMDQFQSGLKQLQRQQPKNTMLLGKQWLTKIGQWLKLAL